MRIVAITELSLAGTDFGINKRVCHSQSSYLPYPMIGYMSKIVPKIRFFLRLIIAYRQLKENI